MTKKVTKKILKDGEVAVLDNDFGILVQRYIRNELRDSRSTEKWLNEKIRSWWPKLEEYYQRQIQCEIEIAIALDKMEYKDRTPLEHKDMWVQFLKDFRPAKSAFTVKYVCGKCKQDNVKLWRDSHTFADHIDLICAKCLAPDLTIDDNGKYDDPDFGKTDQIKSKVPAVPVGDTYWGYTSVPSQDCEWWNNLPTYHKD